MYKNPNVKQIAELKSGRIIVSPKLPNEGPMICVLNFTNYTIHYSQN